MKKKIKIIISLIACVCFISGCASNDRKKIEKTDYGNMEIAIDPKGEWDKRDWENELPHGDLLHFIDIKKEGKFNKEMFLNISEIINKYHLVSLTADLDYDKEDTNSYYLVFKYDRKTSNIILNYNNLDRDPQETITCIMNKENNINCKKREDVSNLDRYFDEEMVNIINKSDPMK